MKPDASWRLVIPNELEEVRGLEFAIARFLEGRAVPARTSYAAQVVVEELVTNAIRHGCAAGGRLEIQVEMLVSPGGVVVTVEDDGIEFDLRPRLAPVSGPRPTLDAIRVGGVGLRLVGAIANRVDYRRVAGRNRVEIHVSEEWGPSS